MRFPRLTIRRWLIVTAAIAIAIVLRQFVGDHCRQQAFYYGAYANSAMMDAAGFDAQAKDMLKNGDQETYNKLTGELATARSQEAFYSRWSWRYETGARLLGMAAEPDYVPPGYPPIPVPIYSGPR